jgi:hypothetical protein
MILDFDRHGSTPLLKPDVSRVGISVIEKGGGETGLPHTNLIQALYVLMPMQPPTEESIK